MFCNCRRIFSALLLCLTLPTLLSCVGGRNYHPIPAEGPVRTARYLQLDHDAQIATLHFPAGTYSLEAEDNIGYYYAAPRKISEHTALGSHLREGGVYVNKRNPKKLRGYVMWGGVRTHVGNLSHVKHEFGEGTEEISPTMNTHP